VGPTARYGNIFRLSYIDDIRTSQETCVGPTARYGNVFRLSYVDYIHN
jgi:hypothetical protein